METMQVPSELEQMVALYVDRKPRRVLEIGAWDGGTLKVWLENAVEGAVVVGVDMNHRNSDRYEEWRREHTALHLYTGNSVSLDAHKFIRDHGPYDWMLVDGDHTDGGVRSDAAICLECANPGAVMVIHDITPATGDATYPPQVLFEEFEAAGYKTQRFQDLTPASWSRGIGIVELP